jgi:dTMP kinase
LSARGKFITLEGGEGAGKSTQARLLAAWLGQKGISVALTREPGGTPSAEDIRNLLVTGEVGRWDSLTETLLHYAARREHMARFILPALAAGQWIICDRFIDSTTAYQGYGQGIDLGIIAGLRETVLGAFIPDLTLILDVTPETRRARTAARPGNEDRYERMNEAFHGRVRAGFHAIAAAEPKRCAVIAADQEIEAVFAAIKRTISENLAIPR